MKKRIFKFGAVRAIVLVLSFLILIMTGFATFDVYILFKSEGDVFVGGYSAIALLGFIY
ncbi:hypothetical protein SAMN05421692_1279 [Chryseobacterium indologenes]|uniref:hypothetical protein n=1 Tax=Chryseobacterium indologenes TaxID=253 RepID=UPI0003E0788B|nr:hypothetical protein [Chryseobacterium indologenes]GAE63249.1 hypothetical protein CIN01S_03_00770 [Chryseobacterium indologenes NBRC 14944]SFJ16815.1 hypothetical protein SAMN05421692_1279 [Chryseobacterium indologenes]SUX49131.1 Uncharacterised protein [Chryseobacterium indologenes]